MVNSTPVSGIYIILNTKNSKVYIGQTARNIRGRWQAHKKELRGNYHNNRHLQRAWNKYGEKSFRFMVLEYCSVEQLNDRETHHIRIYRERGLAYNMTNGGEGTPGHKHTLESRQKMSKSQAGRTHSVETRNKIGEANKRRQQTPEARRKISEAHKGKPLSIETRQKISAANKGRTFSVEHSRKISEAQEKECIWNGIKYRSIKLAALANGIANETMRERLIRGYTCDSDMKNKKRK